MSFNYNHLYYFYQTAKLGGVTHAAKALRLSQPSLSLQLQTLEAQTGLRLLRKEGRNRVLTEEGHRVYSICRVMFEAADELSNIHGSSNDKKKRYLSFGVDMEIDRPFAASVLGIFLKITKARPQISMLSSNSVDLTERLRAEAMDVIFTTQPTFHQDVVILAKYDLPIVLCSGVKLASQLKSSLKKYSQLKLVANTDSSWILPSPRLRLRESIDFHFTKHRVEGPIVFESDNLAALSQAVADNIGVGCLPLPYIKGHLTSKRIQLLYPKESIWNETLYLLTRRGHEKMPSIVELVSAVNKSFEAV